MKTRALSLFTLALGSSIIYLSSCGGNSQKKAESINNGMTLFETNCSACHQKTGEGMSQLYPPLKGSDLLKKDPNRIACIVHNGISGKITVNGKDFEQVMPPLSGLTSQEVADISNYVLNNFNQLDTYLDADGVTKTWENCK